MEILVWGFTHRTTHTANDPLIRVRTRLERHMSIKEVTEKRTITQSAIGRIVSWFKNITFRDMFRNFVIRPAEVTNTAWLAYIIFAQTFGSYQTCGCIASNWAGGPNAIDFSTAADYKAHGIYVYWGASTALSITVMSAGLAYIVHEYCTQSHFSTEDYGRAMQGLRMTRWWKKHTRYIKIIPDLVIRFGKLCFFKISGGKSRQGRRSLIWTADTSLYRLSNLGYRGA